jgi:hypothetical protein
VPGYIIATYVGATRQRTANTITDAVAGAGIGYLIGRSAGVAKREPSRASLNVFPLEGGFACQVRIGLQ